LYSLINCLLEKKMFNTKVFLVEFIGTFALVFIGAGAGLTGSGLLGIALAHGLTIAVFIYAYGHISGTHINPAVTFALALNGTIKWGQAIFYWIAQFAGSALAAYFLLSLVGPLGGDISGGGTVGALTAGHPITAMILEAVMTFFLVNTILHTAVAGNAGRIAGWAIGTTVTIAILVGGPFTGASLNPARTFGPALFSQPSLADPYTYVIYLFGPLIGATLALIVYNFLTGANETAEEVIVVAEVVEEPARARKPAKPAAAARKVTKK
jgi:MIP family channel proteins